MKKKNGFTLIELLVVVAIIAVLISILLPALSQARERSRQILCMTHLQGWGRANMMYMADYNETIAYYNLTGGNWSNFMFLQLFLDRYLLPAAQGKMGGKEMFFCPSDQTPWMYPSPPDPNAQPVLSYGLNCILGGNANFKWSCKPNSQTRPWEPFLMADDYSTTGQTSATVIYDADNIYAGFATRHSGGSNLLYFDWHVSALQDAFNARNNSIVNPHLWYGDYDPKTRTRS